MNRCRAHAAVIWVCMLWLMGCEGKTPEAPPPAPAPPPDAIATWRGGQLGLADIESRLAGQNTPACQVMRQSQGTLDEVVECYREVAETIAIERLVLAEIDDLETAIDQLLVEEPELERNTLLGLYFEALGRTITIEEQQLEAYFGSHPGEFRQPSRITLLSLFRRHEDPAFPENTIKLLKELRDRIETGESFSDIAEQYSHSETRLKGGWIGLIEEGDLPPNLEKAAFALDDGELSDPIRVKGGAVLLQVRDSDPGFDIPYNEAKASIEGRLRAERMEEIVTQKLAELPQPEGAMILGRDELMAAVDGSGPVLKLGSVDLDAEEFKSMAGLHPLDRVSDQEQEFQDALFELYQRRVRRARLHHLILESDNPEDQKIRVEASEALEAAAPTLLVDRHLNREMEESSSISQEDLKSYFYDHRAIFQSKLRFRLRLWRCPYGPNPPQQMARLEGLYRALSSNEIELEQAVEQLGGELEDLGWRSLDELPSNVPWKLPELLARVHSGEFTSPFRQDDAFFLAAVEEREEPRLLSFDEAADAVRREYLGRHGQEIYRQIVQERLRAQAFEFHETTCRHLLAG